MWQLQRLHNQDERVDGAIVHGTTVFSAKARGKAKRSVSIRAVSRRQHYVVLYACLSQESVRHPAACNPAKPLGYCPRNLVRACLLGVEAGGHPCTWAWKLEWAEHKVSDGDKIQGTRGALQASRAAREMKLKTGPATV